jgi:pentatricopeptide repeat protein
MHIPVTCANLGTFKDNKIVHKQFIQNGCEYDAFVGSNLVNMYAKCGSMEDAWRTFKKISSQDVLTWTAMVLGQIKCCQ